MNRTTEPVEGLEFRNLETVVKYAVGVGQLGVEEEAGRILEELQLLDLHSTAEVVKAIESPPLIPEENLFVPFLDTEEARRPQFQNLFEQKLYEAGFARWDEKFLQRFFIYSLSERGSSLSCKRILGVLKIIKKMRKLPRGILIMVAQYAADFEGDKNTVVHAKYNIDCICPAPLGDLYVSTERKIYRWNFVTWKLTTVIRKLKNIDAEMMCYGGDENLFVLSKHDTIDVIDLKNQEKKRLHQFTHIQPSMLRSFMSFDGKEAKVIVLTNFALFFYNNNSKIWLKYHMPDYNPRTIHLFKNQFYSLSKNQCKKLEFDPKIEDNEIRKIEGSVYFDDISLATHDLTLPERKFKAKIYSGMNYGFMTKYGEWVRIHRQALTGYVLDTESQRKNARPYSIILEEKFTNIKNCWTYEPFANVLYKVSGKEKMQIEQIVL